MEKFVCIHGHFYQPPRENPWLEEIEVQDSAYPYHDWNEKVSAECYAPNAASRLLSGEGRITDIVSNYSRISFNFSPTLLAWMKIHDSELYQSILDADRQSVEWRSGHGNAIAQPYNHLIMPLATLRDKYSQTLWGIRDFEHRFGRFPEGMWLPETAVDMETLEVLSKCGIRFTILSPRQAARVRKIGTGRWKDVSGERIDSSQSYLCVLPSGRSINLFFYDAPISRAIAFEGLLNRGEDFVGRILSGLSDERQWPQIVAIATDGETYGHHHRFGDMALAYALHHLESNGLAILTNFGEYLEKNPPQTEVQIFENTSWSCSHGIERWRSNCGCNSGSRPEWSQQWRAPLREAFDHLRDALSPLFEAGMGKLLREPWGARDDYVGVILDRRVENADAFLGSWAKKRLSTAERIEVMKSMEMQRHAMLMYTSCGWFFDELSGIETLQVLQYCGRAIQLAQDLYGIDLETGFTERLSRALSNISDNKDGAHIFRTLIKPSAVDLGKLAIHYAISSLIKDYSESEKIYCFSVKREDYQRHQVAETKIAVGRVAASSDITGETGTFNFCALHLGGHVFSGGMMPYRDEETYRNMKDEITNSFEQGALVDIIRLLDQHFGAGNFSLLNLFKDEQRRILGIVTAETEKELEDLLRLTYEKNHALMRFLSDTGTPVPKALKSAAELSLNTHLGKGLKQPVVEESVIRESLNEMRKWGLAIDTTELEFMLRRKIEAMMGDLAKKPADTSLLTSINALLGLLKALPFEVNLWQIQNSYYMIANKFYGDFLLKANTGDGAAGEWIEAFGKMGDQLMFNTSSVLEKG